MPNDREQTGKARLPSADNSADPLEQELAERLCRVAAPDGFAEKVMRRVRAPERAAWSRWVWAIAAMLLLAVLATAQQQRQRHQIAEAARVADQFALAMRITHAALLHAGQGLDRHSPDAGRDTDDQTRSTND